MAEQLKSAFGPQRVARIADEFAQAWPAFPKAAFLGQVLEGFDDVGLMDRCRRVADALAATLPTGFPDAVQVVLRTLGPPLEGGDGHGMEGFHYLPHSLFLSIRGLAHPDLALEAMRHVTSRSSCEFAIRPFLEQHQGQTLRVLHAWTQDPDEHVRRLVSEGTRPRLPWATRLTAFQQDPSPNLGLLEKLRDDPSPYVRRSVANHLNDIAKDHPDVAIATCRRWLQDASADRRRLVHHALRSLARSGHPDAIALLGGHPGSLRVRQARVGPARVRIGTSFRVEATLRNDGASPARAVLGVRVHFVRARGQTTPHTFRLRTLDVPAGATATAATTISVAQHTTRRHYPGHHRVELILNGVPHDAGSVTLLPEA